jgi:hypothetical protein
MSKITMYGKLSHFTRFETKLFLLCLSCINCPENCDHFSYLPVWLETVSIALTYDNIVLKLFLNSLAYDNIVLKLFLNSLIFKKLSEAVSI